MSCSNCPSTFCKHGVFCPSTTCGFLNPFTPLKNEYRLCRKCSYPLYAQRYSDHSIRFQEKSKTMMGGSEPLIEMSSYPLYPKRPGPEHVAVVPEKKCKPMEETEAMENKENKPPPTPETAAKTINEVLMEESAGSPLLHSYAQGDKSRTLNLRGRAEELGLSTIRHPLALDEDVPEFLRYEYEPVFNEDLSIPDSQDDDDELTRHYFPL